MPDTSITGAAGEHLVMSRLLWEGRIAALAPAGAKGIDILISDAAGENLAAVQVKTAGSEVGANGWQMNKKHEALRSPRLFYVFVCPGSKERREATCWVVPSAIVADHVAATHEAWLTDNTAKRARNDSGKRAFHRWATRPPMERYGEGWLDEYEEAWHLLDGFTKVEGTPMG